MARKTATLPATAVEPELREALAAIAAEAGVSLGHVIRRACEAYVQVRPPRQPTVVAAAKRGPESASDIAAAIFRRTNGGQ